MRMKLKDKEVRGKEAPCPQKPSCGLKTLTIPQNDMWKLRIKIKKCCGHVTPLQHSDP